MLSMEQLASCGVVPVVVLNDVKDAVPTAKALLRGGINVMEITFRTAAARDCIAKVAAEVPEIIAGAGTVVNVEQAREAVAAGAKFLVSPGSDPDVIAEAARLDVPIVPGVVTPSEIMMGLKLGIKVFKFFPAESYGGLKTIKALSGPSRRPASSPPAAFRRRTLPSTSRTRRSRPWVAAGWSPPP